MVYRIYVDSAKRRSGHPFDFEYDITGVVTSRCLVGRTWMAAVEWCTTVKYSTSSPSYARVNTSPGTLLLACPEFAADNTLDSWTGAPSQTLCALQNYAKLGYYGVSADTPYLRRPHLGCLVKGDRFQQAGSLRFRLLEPRRAPDTTQVAPLGAPNGFTIHGEDFQFSLVLWETEEAVPRAPSPTYPFYKLWLSSRGRSSGNPCAALIPFRFPTGGAMSTGAWQVAVESFSLLHHPVSSASQAEGVAVVCDELAADSLAARPNVIGYLARSYRTGEAGTYGQVLSIKPASSDAVGHPVRAQLDRLCYLTVELRDAATLGQISVPATVSDWVCCLTFFRVKQ